MLQQGERLEVRLASLVHEEKAVGGGGGGWALLHSSLLHSSLWRH